MSLNRKHFQENFFYQKSLFIWIFLILTLWHTPNSNLGHLSYWVKVFKSDSRYKWNKKVSVVCVCVVQMNITMIFLWIHNSAVLFLMVLTISFLLNEQLWAFAQTQLWNLSPHFKFPLKILGENIHSEKSQFFKFVLQIITNHYEIK